MFQVKVTNKENTHNSRKQLLSVKHYLISISNDEPASSKRRRFFLLFNSLC